MDLNEFVERNKKNNKDIAAALKPHYHGIDRSLVSKLRNPARYGIRLIRHAEIVLIEACAVKPYKPRRGDRHRLQYKLSCRVSETKYGGVHTAITRFRFPSASPTVQTFMDYATDFALENPEQFQRFIDERSV
jgi:hypothetical protein